MLLITDISDRMLSIQQEMLCSSQIFHWSWTTDNIEYFKFLGNLAGIHSQNETHEAKGDWLLHKNTFSKNSQKNTYYNVLLLLFLWNYHQHQHAHRKISDGLHPIQFKHFILCTIMFTQNLSVLLVYALYTMMIHTTLLT